MLLLLVQTACLFELEKRFIVIYTCTCLMSFTVTFQNILNCICRPLHVVVCISMPLGQCLCNTEAKMSPGDDCGLSRCMFTQQLALASYFVVWLLIQLSLPHWNILLRSKEFSLYRKPQRVCTQMLHVNLPGQLTTS